MHSIAVSDAENLYFVSFCEARDDQLVGQHLHLHNLRGEVQAAAGAVHCQVVPVPQVGHGGRQSLQEEPGMNCIKIGLPEKLVLSKRKKFFGKFYSLENSSLESIFREDLFLYNCLQFEFAKSEASGYYGNTTLVQGGGGACLMMGNN